MRSIGRKSLLASVAVAAIAIGVGLTTYAASSLGSLERRTLDARFDVRGADTPSDVAVVAIDERTLAQLGGEWPLPRCLHAQVIDRLAAAKPSAIAMDIQFTEPSDAVAPDGTLCDTVLADAVRGAGNVVLGTTEISSRGRTNIFGGDVRQLGAREAATLLPTDEDGVTRRMSYDVDMLKTFGVVAAEVAKGVTVKPPPGGEAWVDFAGRPGTVPTYSYVDVLRGKVPGSAFENKIVVVGASAPSLGDLHATSAAGDELMSGPEVSANAIETALHGFPLRSVWGAWNVFFIVLLGLVAPLARLRLNLWQSLLAALAGSAVFLVVAQLAFMAGHVVAVTYPLLTVGISCIGVLVAETSFARERSHRVRTTRETRRRLAGGVAVIAIGITLGCYAGHLLRSLELKSVDTRFDIRGSTETPDDVVVVKIDPRTFGDLADWGRLNAIRSGSVTSQLRRIIDGIEHPETRDVTVSPRPGLGDAYHVALTGASHWPFKRHYYQLALDQIEKGHPSAVTFDIQFTEPTDPYEDNALINAVARGGNVVLSTTEVDKGGHTQIFGGDSFLKQIGARPGYGNIPVDSDGIKRRMAYSVNGLKSLGIVTAEIAKGRPIPNPGGSYPWIDFAGPPGTIKSYSFFQVMNGQIPPSAFRDKMVVIGASAPVLQDVHATSTSGTASSALMSGPELQANAALTALRGFPLRSIWTGWNFVLIVLFGLIAPLASLRMKGWRGPALAVGVGALFVVAVQLAFNNGRVVTLTYPLLALGLSAIGVLVSEYILEAFERVRTHDTFSRFVPEAVVNQVLERTGGELRLGGELVEGTAMFTDLRGFTTFSEGLPADEVIGLLNGYLGEISDAVLAHGGTLVSYLGDGLMAVFGAPLPQDDHADRALASAREMLEVRLPQYNEILRAQGFERGFKMGIGLNSGPFMSGNVGSQRRLEYTAIGDTINTASRIEGMTKGTPYALYLADSVKESLRTPVDDLVYIDEMPVRGRTQPIKLWSLDADYVQKENWEAEVAHPEPKPPSETTPTEDSEEPVPA